jgi:beta-mannosidase
LVWQDFMFACGIYPTDDVFFENVHGEITQVVRRLRHRACLALWCGNNEMEQGWCEWNWTKNSPKKARQAYDRMFHKLIPQWVAAEDTDISYWPSSPSSNTPFKKPNAEDRGDGHYWGVWHGREPFTAYRKHGFRFQSEFGFQSLPPFETVKTYAAPEDLNMTSRIMEHHQRSGSGNGLIIHYLTQQYRMPKDFATLCYLSQILQAEGIRYGVEFWRRNSARTKGTLYWQINDCWQVCSWASIDYFGRWKALHYYARRFYAPVLLSGNEDGTKVALHVTSDLRKPFSGHADWQLVTFDGEVLKKGRLAVRAKPNADTPLKTFDFAEELKDGMARRAVMVIELFGKDGSRISRGMVSFAPYKHQELPEPALRAEVADAISTWQVSVKAAKLARFVEVRLEDQAPEAIWSDNYFDLPAGGEQTVALAKQPGETIEQIRSRLRLRSLRETY